MKILLLAKWNFIGNSVDIGKSNDRWIFSPWIFMSSKQMIDGIKSGKLIDHYEFKTIVTHLNIIKNL